MTNNNALGRADVVPALSERATGPGGGGASMTDHELIQVLRKGCLDCPYKPECKDAHCKLHLLSADRIAALQSENAEKRKEITRVINEQLKLMDRAKLAEAALSRVGEERDAAVADLHSMHTLCTDIGGCCPECGSQIDELLDAACTFCRGTGVNCWKNDPGNENKCAAFEWRGAQGEA